MYHPVRMALDMDHLDPEDQNAVRSWSARIAVACCASAVVLFAVVATTTSIPAPQAGVTEREATTGVFWATSLAARRSPSGK